MTRLRSEGVVLSRRLANQDTTGDTVVRTAKAVQQVGGIVSADQVTVSGDGTADHPLTAVPQSIGVAVDGTSISGDGTMDHPLSTVPDGTPVAVDGSSIVGDGTTGNPLAAVGGPSGAGNSDGVTLQGTGLLVNPYAIKAVQHDTTLAGNGTVGSPLGVSVAALAPALAGLVAVETDGVTLSGNGESGTPLAVVPSALADEVPVLADGVTILGDGTTGNPLIATASAGTTIYFNVKAYGAVGNGIADDTNAIRAAITAALAAGGGTVYFPDGTYLISEHASTFQCLSGQNGVSFLGQSRGGSILFLANGQRESVRMLYVVASSSDLSIETLTFNGNASGQSGPNTFHRDEIFLDNTARVTIFDVTCTNGFASGIVIWQNSIDTLVEHVYVTGCSWQGIVWGDAGGQQRSTVRDCYVLGNAGGIHIEVSVAAGGFEIDHCTCDAFVGNPALNIVGGSNTDTTKIITAVRVNDCIVNGAVNVADAADVVCTGLTVTCADTAPTPQPAIKVAGLVVDCTFDDCTVTLTAAGTSPQAVWFAGNTNNNTVGTWLVDSRVYVQSAGAHGVTLQSISSASVRGTDVIGNASLANGFYGINLYAKTNGSGALECDGNYLADFQYGIAAQAASGSYHTADVMITRNRFQSIARAMDACMSLDEDGTHTIQQAEVWGNSPIGAIPMFATYPNVPMLVGGNRGGVEILSTATSPAGAVTAPIGSTAYARDTGNAFLNKDGTSSGWHQVTTA